MSQHVRRSRRSLQAGTHGLRTYRSSSQTDNQLPVAVPGLREQMRMALHLMGATPGLSVYLVGGFAVWLITRALLSHGLADSALGALAVGVCRILGLALVTVLYFRRTGQLAQGWAELRRLRVMLSDPMHDHAYTAMSWWRVRLLRWCLRVKRYRR